MSLSENQAKQLFAKTAQHIRDQQNEIARLRQDNAALASVKEAQEKRDKFRQLAKRAAARGMIDSDVDSVDEFVDKTMSSGRSLDVMEQSIELANDGFFSSVKEASAETAEDTSSTAPKNMNAVARLILGANDAD